MLPLEDRLSPAGVPSRICLIGETGSGKSTTAELLRQCLARAGYPTRTIQLAEPLRQLQNLVYRRIGEPKPPERQDQQLMYER